MPGWNGLTRKEKHQVLNKQIVDTCKLPEMFCRCLICGQNSSLTTNLSIHTDFDPKVVQGSNPKPMIGFISITQERMMFLSGPRSPLHKIMFPSQNRRNRRKDYPKKMMRNLSLAFFISSRGILLRTQEHVAHVGGICCGQTGLKHETNHHLHFYCCPNQATKKDVERGKTTTCLLTGTPMLMTSYMSSRTLL